MYNKLNHSNYDFSPYAKSIVCGSRFGELDYSNITKWTTALPEYKIIFFSKIQLFSALNIWNQNIDSNIHKSVILYMDKVIMQ